MTVAAPPSPIHRAPAQHCEGDHATATDLARRGGGPQDRALYQCSCGSVFTAAVTTSVGCPACGSGQAW